MASKVRGRLNTLIVHPCHHDGLLLRVKRLRLLQCNSASVEQYMG